MKITGKKTWKDDLINNKHFGQLWEWGPGEMIKIPHTI